MQYLDTNQCINLITLILIHTHTNFGINIIACPPLVFTFKQGNKLKNKERNTQTSVLLSQNPNRSSHYHQSHTLSPFGIYYDSSYTHTQSE